MSEHICPDCGSSNLSLYYLASNPPHHKFECLNCGRVGNQAELTIPNQIKITEDFFAGLTESIKQAILQAVDEIKRKDREHIDQIRKKLLK